MHMRTVRKNHPALAADIQEVLDVITYILNIITQVWNLLTSVLGSV